MHLICVLLSVATLNLPLLSVSEVKNDLYPAPTYLKEVYDDISSLYDRWHPIYARNTQPVLLTHHSKRCAYLEPGKVVQGYVRGNSFRNATAGNQILISTPCLGADSFGNMLGSYFENILCAHHTGLHFMAVAMVWEPKKEHRGSAFVDSLPRIIENPYPQGEADIKSTIKQKCKCVGACHERVRALWPTGKDVIKPIFYHALQAHMSTLQGSANNTIIAAADIANVPKGTVLPLIPDAAIHYRCGDNFVGHYGFLPFAAFPRLIPLNSSTIFVLAESRDRKSMAKSKRAEKCDMILKGLFTFLNERYPSSTVVVRRGDDLHTDLARLAYAKVTVCSVSTFCLWPAFVGEGMRHFPVSRLIVGGLPSVDLGPGFKWIRSPSVILGAKNEHIPAGQLLAKLLRGG